MGPALLSDEIPLSSRALAKINEGVRELRAELLWQLREEERLLALQPCAVILAAPSDRCHVKADGASYLRDLGFTVKKGRVEWSWVYHRHASEHGYHPAHVWAGTEQRLDVFGHSWSRYIEGYFLMDDFGDLVEVPR